MLFGNKNEVRLLKHQRIRYKKMKQFLCIRQTLPMLYKESLFWPHLQIERNWLSNGLNEYADET